MENLFMAENGTKLNKIVSLHRHNYLKNEYQ